MTMIGGGLVALVLVLVVLVCGACAATTTLQSSSAQGVWSTAINSAAPGDTIIFSAGTYNFASRFTLNIVGSSALPITIMGAVGTRPVMYRPNANQNLWDIKGQYFTIKNLDFFGGSKGLRLGDGGNVTNAVFDDLTIHDTADTAFSANDASIATDYNTITISGVQIRDTCSTNQYVGECECFYLGCNNDGCRFRNSLITNVFCSNTLFAKTDYGAGIQIKTGSYNNVIRNSAFWNIRGVGVLLYDSYDRGNNLVDGVVVVSTGDVGIQFTAGAVIRNSIVINATGAGLGGIANQPKPGTYARNIQLIGNTVIGSQDACLRGNSWLPANQATITIANNVFFCDGNDAFRFVDNPSGVTWRNNGYAGALNIDAGSDAIPAAGLIAMGSLAAEFVSPATNNFYPKSTSSLVAAGVAQSLVSNPYSFDYCLRSTTAPTVGAYEYSTGVTGQALTLGFKAAVCAASSGSSSGGSSSTSTGSATGASAIDTASESTAATSTAGTSTSSSAGSTGTSTSTNTSTAAAATGGVSGTTGEISAARTGANVGGVFVALTIAVTALAL